MAPHDTPLSKAQVEWLARRMEHISEGMNLKWAGFRWAGEQKFLAQFPIRSPKTDGLSVHSFPLKGPGEENPWAEVQVFSEAKLSPRHVTILEDMTDTLVPFARLSPAKRDLYMWLDKKIEVLVESRRPLNKESWSGIYFVAGPQLALGPYRGFKTEHHLIPVERGLCGAAIRENRTVVADDVKANPEYLSCSIHTRSEVVIPIRLPTGQAVAELDLDSPLLAAYDVDDVHSLEKWCEELGRAWARERFPIPH